MQEVEVPAGSGVSGLADFATFTVDGIRDATDDATVSESLQDTLQEDTAAFGESLAQSRLASPIP